MKRKLLLPLIFLLIFPGLSLSAQTIHEPNDQIYKDIDRWQVQGYIREFLPLIRPYPITLIDKILDEVIQNGDSGAREKAEFYRERLSADSRSLRFGAWAYMQGKNDENGFIGAPFAESMFRITDFLSVSFHIAEVFMTDMHGERFNIPGTYTPYADLVYDTASVGGVELRPFFTSLMAIGNSDAYFQAGLSRTSVGPFFDNGIIVGPQTPKAGHFSFVFSRPQWSYEMLFQSLAATDDFGGGSWPNKYNIVHYITYRPIVNLEFGFVQTLVWGDRLEPLYLVPFSFLYASQSLSGFDDNNFMGIHVRWRPIDTFLVNGQLYVDDFSFNGIFSGEQKPKLALEAGISWAPKTSLLSKLDLDYTAVFPYTYTHWNQDNDNRYTKNHPNFLNYTHKGRNIGPDLEPNSDRISLRTNWTPLSSVDINLSAYLIRHANASKGLDSPGDPSGSHDGSIFDDGSYNDGTKVTHNPRHNIFLLTGDQGPFNIRLGGGVGISWTIPSSIGIFRLTGEYGLEYGWNRDLVKGKDSLDQYWSIGGMWSW